MNNYVAAVLIQATYTLLMVKIFSRKVYISIRDCILIIVVGLFGGYLRPDIGIWSTLVLIGFLCYYNYRIGKYSFRKSFFITSIVMLISISFEHSIPLISQQIFYESSFNEDLLIIYVAISAVLSVLFICFFTKVTKRVRTKINEIELFQFLLTSISVSMLIALLFYIGSDIKLIELNFFFVLAGIEAVLVVLYHYSKALHEKFEIQREKDELENLSKYIQEVETHYTDIRKFKHDYQNILASLDDYIKNEDYEGLKHYYLEKIKPASTVMDQHQFELEPLSKIKIREIKSILAVKLMEAQELGIDVTFEVEGEINHLSVNSLVIVRSLGILLDNAIEELVTLGSGVLRVGALKDETSTMFVIQNTCRDQIERVHLLKQAGFSTKGEGRGMGLNNLAGFAKEHPNMRIETSIVDNQFVQKIIVGG